MTGLYLLLNYLPARLKCDFGCGCDAKESIHHLSTDAYSALFNALDPVIWL